MIQNVQIINYFPDELEQQSKRANEQYNNDPLTKRLNKNIRITEIVTVICFAITLISLATIATIIITATTHQSLQILLMIFIPGAIACLAALIPCALVASNYNFIQRRNQIFHQYNSPSILYHTHISNSEILACYGQPYDENKFEVIVTVQRPETDYKSVKSFIFDYDTTNPDGVPTLDVKRGVVFLAMSS